MANDRAVASLMKNVAKLQARLADLDPSDEQAAELEQSIADLQANLDRWASE
jgi:DNA repair ATPase RecN